MGAARLLAKAWIVFCVFAGAYEVRRLVFAGSASFESVLPVIVCVLLFGAMGLLFIGGFGMSGTAGGEPLLARLRPAHLVPGFNGIVFVVFAVAVFAVQTAYLPDHVSGGVLSALEAAVQFAVPGQRALENRLMACTLDGGRIVASALSWILACVFLGSGLSRVRLAAGILRLERRAYPPALGAAAFTLLLGLLAVVGIQFLFLGTAFDWMPCDVLIDIPGQFLIGLGPLLLAYLIVVAVTDLLALGPKA